MKIIALVIALMFTFPAEAQRPTAHAAKVKDAQNRIKIQRVYRLTNAIRTHIYSGEPTSIEIHNFANDRIKIEQIEHPDVTVEDIEQMIKFELFNEWRTTVLNSLAVARSYDVKQYRRDLNDLEESFEEKWKRIASDVPEYSNEDQIYVTKQKCRGNGITVKVPREMKAKIDGSTALPPNTVELTTVEDSSISIYIVSQRMEGLVSVDNSQSIAVNYAIEMMLDLGCSEAMEVQEIDADIKAREKKARSVQIRPPAESEVQTMSEVHVCTMPGVIITAIVLYDEEDMKQAQSYARTIFKFAMYSPLYR